MALGRGIVTKVTPTGIDRDDYIDYVTDYEVNAIGVLIVLTETSAHYYAPGRWAEFDLIETDDEAAADG